MITAPQYEELKSAISLPPDARDIDDLDHWFKTSSYGYTIN
jgi:hypothetical protein